MTAVFFDIKKFFVFVFVFLFILNPYTEIGPLAYFLIPILFFLFLFWFRYVDFEVIFLSMFLVVLSMIGVFSSIFHGIFQLAHLKVSLSILVYVIFSQFIFLSARFKKFHLSFNDLVSFCLCVVLINSLVILLQVLLPEFRFFMEGFLTKTGNVDWTDGVRYRGLASGGGASLSVLTSVAIALALYLYTEQVIGIWRLLLTFLILITSLFFIGRTGFFLIPFVFFAFVLINLKNYFYKVFTTFSVLFFSIFFFGDDIKEFIVSRYGLEFYHYSFGFFLGGLDELKKEGTIDVIIDFLKVMPNNFPEVFIGYGFYGEGDFHPWTDSGYSRMFLSIGYFFGALYYFVFFLMFRNIIFRKRSLFLMIGIILLIAEAKEPLLFSGYASRLYILILVFAVLERKMERYKSNCYGSDLRGEEKVKVI